MAKLVWSLCKLTDMLSRLHYGLFWPVLNGCDDRDGQVEMIDVYTKKKCFGIAICNVQLLQVPTLRTGYTLPCRFSEELISSSIGPKIKGITTEISSSCHKSLRSSLDMPCYVEFLRS
jgi:hypothetical protein